MGYSYGPIDWDSDGRVNWNQAGEEHPPPYGVRNECNRTENDGFYYFWIPAPGAIKDKIKITVADNTITVIANIDYPWGTKRTIAMDIDIPTNGDSDKINSIMHNGLLEINIQKTKEPRSVPIEIKVT